MPPTQFGSVYGEAIDYWSSGPSYRGKYSCRVRARTRLDVIPSSNVNVCATSKATGSLELVAEALTEARINIIYLVQFGMKCPLTEIHFLERSTIHSTDNTRWDIGFNVRSNSIVALTSSVPLVLVNGMFLEDE